MLYPPAVLTSEGASPLTDGSTFRHAPPTPHSSASRRIVLHFQRPQRSVIPDMLASLHLVAYQQALVVVEGTYRCTGQCIVVVKTTLQPPEPGRHNLGTHKRRHSASDMAACSGLDAEQRGRVCVKLSTNCVPCPLLHQHLANCRAQYTVCHNVLVARDTALVCYPQPTNSTTVEIPRSHPVTSNLIDDHPPIQESSRSHDSYRRMHQDSCHSLHSVDSTWCVRLGVLP